MILLGKVGVAANSYLGASWRSVSRRWSHSSAKAEPGAGSRLRCPWANHGFRGRGSVTVVVAVIGTLGALKSADQRSAWLVTVLSVIVLAVSLLLRRHAAPQEEVRAFEP
jgi:hypothetical protein